MFEVAIIGGGLSGLAANYSLVKNGIKTILFEEKELGGRIATEKINGFYLEKGAVYLVYKGNALTKYLNELKINHKLVKVSKNIDFLYENELHRLSFQEPVSAITSLINFKLMENQQKYNLKFLKLIYNSIKSLRNIKKNYNSLQKYNSLNAKEFLLQYLDKEVIDDVFEPIAETFLFSNLKSVSAAIFMVLFGCFVDFNNNIYHINKSIGELKDKLEEQVKSKKGIIKQKTKIISIRKKKNYFEIKDSKGNKYSSKTVISSIPLTKLKKINSKLFQKLGGNFNKIRYLPIISGYFALKKPLKIINNHLTFIKANETNPLSFIGEATYKNSKLSPKGKGLVYVIFSPRYYNKIKKMSGKQLSKIVLKNFPELKENLLFYKFYKWEEAFTLTDINYFKSLKTKTNVSGFYICGDSVMVGLDGVLHSAELASKNVIEFLV